MAVQYTGHVISVCITLSVYCTVIGWRSGDVIWTIRTICINIINYIYQKCKINLILKKIAYIYDFSYNFETVLYQFLMCIVQCLRFSGFILYPLSFFLYRITLNNNIWNYAIQRVYMSVSKPKYIRLYTPLYQYIYIWYTRKHEWFSYWPLNWVLVWTRLESQYQTLNNIETGCNNS